MKSSLFLERVRKEKPLVHHLTNWVTIGDCAAVVKAFGAAPVMAHAAEEVADMADIASSLVLNIGTLTSDFVEAMKLAAKKANQKGIPVVLDACGAGATAFRDQKSLELLNGVRINILKGNASEIARIAGEDVRTKGVESFGVDKNLTVLAKDLSKERNCIVIITGSIDIVVDKDKVYRVLNGCEVMGNIVGTGCMSTSSVGTFAAVAQDNLAEAAAAGLCCFEIAAELAAEKAKGPWDFKMRLFDEIYALDSKVVDKRQKIE